MWPLNRHRIGFQPAQLEEAAVPVELWTALEHARPHLVPLQSVIVARVLLDLDAVQVEFLLVPTADDVKPGAPVRDVIDGGNGLGRERGRDQRDVDGREYTNLSRQRPDGRAVRHGLE